MLVVGAGPVPGTVRGALKLTAGGEEHIMHRPAWGLRWGLREGLSSSAERGILRR